MKLQTRRPIKCSDWSGGAYQLTTKATVLGISIQPFLLWLPCRTYQVPQTTTANTVFFIYFFVCLFVLLMGMWLQAYIIVFLKYQLMIFYHKSTIMHTYVDIYIEIYSQLTHTPTQLHFVYNIVVIVWSHVVITSLTNNIFIKL